METEVTSQVVKALEEAAAAARPQESCGILLGKGTVVTQFEETRNTHPTPHTHFEIDPQALINAHREAREGDLQVMGYFHSHPNGRASPSKTDQANAAGDGKIWAIWGENTVRFWCDSPSGFREVSYSVKDD